MAMVSSSRQIFLSTTTPLTSSAHKPSNKFRPKRLRCCRSKLEEDADPSSTSSNRLARLAIVTLAAGVLTLGSAHDAMAAKSGGRVGGQAFRSAAPRPSSPRINRSRTNIYVNPPVAPPLFGGYGYGSPFYGGWGWSPFSFFAPGPSVAVGGGFDFFALFLVLSVGASVLRSFTRRKDDNDDEDDY